MELKGTFEKRNYLFKILKVKFFSIFRLILVSDLTRFRPHFRCGLKLRKKFIVSLMWRFVLDSNRG